MPGAGTSCPRSVCRRNIPMNNTITAQLQWDADGQPVSTQFNDVYFSRDNGLQESRYVFLQHNRLAERFSSLLPGKIFVVGETGFGTGLNFLSTWQLWQQHATPNAQLHFVSVEAFPLTRADLARALAIWPELAAYARTLIEHYPPVSVRGLHRLTIASNVHLTLVFNDACDGLSQLLTRPASGPKVASLSTGWSAVETRPRAVDAWFLDGFAPARNPGMWRQGLFDVLAKLSQPGTTLATFTAAGTVRRGLADCGFTMDKVPGYGRKREMLTGVFSGSSAAIIAAATVSDNTVDSVNTAPPAVRVPADRTIGSSWHLAQKSIRPVRTIAIIGAGLAGCHTAHALARRGFKVTVIERETPGAGGSGNAQGILYSKLSAKPGALAEFNVHALLYASQLYQKLGLFASTGSRCGVLQVATSSQQETNYQQVAARFDDSAFAHWLGCAQASEVAGVQLRFGALHMPGNGWLQPSRICAALLDHPGIEILNGTPVRSLQNLDHAWQVFDAGGTRVIEADAVIVACATATADLSQCRNLPLKPIPGQVSHVCSTDSSRHLRTVLCGNSYIAPALDDRHCLGATFRLHSDNMAVTESDHQENLLQTARLSSDLNNLAIDPLTPGRVSTRCTTPDYLPLAGPVARYDTMQQRFAPYRFNAKTVIDEPGDYWPGLFVNTGHGSKGLTYTPICAELVAAMLCGEPLPLGRTQVMHLHPARFLIRALRRKQ